MQSSALLNRYRQPALQVMKVDHADRGMRAIRRAQLLQWLRFSGWMDNVARDNAPTTKEDASKSAQLNCVRSRDTTCGQIAITVAYLHSEKNLASLYVKLPSLDASKIL